MKTIQPVTIWDNGQNLEAKILNTYASNVTLGLSATFAYLLFTDKEDGSQGVPVRQGSLEMTGESYTQWEVDSYAWDWVAAQLNLCNHVFNSFLLSRNTKYVFIFME